MYEVVVMYRCARWTIKKAEHWRIDAVKLVLENSCVPWVARKWNQSVLKEINPEYSLEGLMLKLKLQYFGHLMWRADSLEKTRMLGKTEGRRRRGPRRMRWLDGITDSKHMSLGSSRRCWRTGKPGVLQSMGLKSVGHDRVTEQSPQQQAPGCTVLLSVW